ncbi:MAG: hypothetical protein JO260_10710 [Acidobacteria bacterium]|nr:hypothetical protein [Acidobacteriota bacterium]
MVGPRWLARLTFDNMQSAMYGIVAVGTFVILSLAAYMWYLTPGKRDRL